MPATTLLVAYPKELIRAGLRAMLEKTGIKIVGEADDDGRCIAPRSGYRNFLETSCPVRCPANAS